MDAGCATSFPLPLGRISGFALLPLVPTGSWGGVGCCSCDEFYRLVAIWESVSVSVCLSVTRGRGLGWFAGERADSIVQLQCGIHFCGSGVRMDQL